MVFCLAQCTLDRSRPVINPDSTFYYLSSYYPTQTFRIELKQPSTLDSIKIVLDGKESGQFDLDIYGHEGGAIKPSFKGELTSTVRLSKDSVGAQMIVHKFEDTLKLTNDYFFISLSNFETKMGVLCDSTFADICQSDNTDNYIPPLILEDKKEKSRFKSGNAQIELFYSNDTIGEFFFSERLFSIDTPSSFFSQSISWEDINNDRWVDLLIGNALYRNDSGTFETPLELNCKSRHSRFVDFDNDGDADIMSFGPRGARYFSNEAGKFSFSKHFSDFSFLNPQSICISDINNDRYPDFFVAQLWSAYPKPLPNYLLSNKEGKELVDKTSLIYPTHNGINNFPYQLGMEVEPEVTNSKPNENLNKRSRAAQFIDFDQDGDSDLYVANYFLEEDEFYENISSDEFLQRTTPSDSMISIAPQCEDNFFNHGTGISWFDFDNDGDFDFILSQLAHPSNVLELDHFGTTLFVNTGNSWEPAKNNAGLRYEESHSGVATGDLNNDGLEDVIVASYYECRFLDVYMQKENHTFEMKTFESGLIKIDGINDICLVDYNNDGKLDISLIDRESFRLFENKISTNNNWLKIKLSGDTVNSFGIGVTVKLYSGSDVYTKQLYYGKGQSMQSPALLHFGLSNHREVDKIEVMWSKDRIQTLKRVKANQLIEIVENR